MSWLVMVSTSPATRFPSLAAESALASSPAFIYKSRGVERPSTTLAVILGVNAMERDSGTATTGFFTFVWLPLLLLSWACVLSCYALFR